MISVIRPHEATIIPWHPPSWFPSSQQWIPAAAWSLHGFKKRVHGRSTTGLDNSQRI